MKMLQIDWTDVACHACVFRVIYAKWGKKNPEEFTAFRGYANQPYSMI